MPAFKDLGEVLDPGLPLPINGTTYTVPAVDAETGLRLQRLSDWMFGVAVAAHNQTDAPEPGQEVLGDAEELDLYRDALGSAYDAMVVDGVSWPQLKVAGMTAFLYWTVGEQQAQQYWESGGNPEQPAGNRANRRAARSTPRQGSASGTTTTAAPRKQAAKGTRGAKSSTGGR